MTDIAQPISKWQRYRLRDLDGYRKRKREYAKSPEQREKRRLYMQRWREENREKHNEQARESHHRNKHKHTEKRRDYHLQRSYGLTQEEYDALLESQGGCCRICGDSQNNHSRSFHLDHDHQTGAVRGILCGRCNTALGWYEKNREGVESYL